MTILAETSGFNDIFTNVLLVVHVVICIILCLTVLMQRPKQEGLGAAFGGGMTDQAFGARTTDVLQKGTVYLATGLFIVTLILSILVGSASTDEKISDSIENDKTEAVEEYGDEAAAAAAEAASDGEVTQDDLNEAIKEATADLETGGVEATPEVTPDVPAPVEEPAETPAGQ